MSKTAIVFGKKYRYEPDGTIWHCQRAKGIRMDRPLGTNTRAGYLTCTINYNQKKVHHVVWFIHKGYWPSNLDHKNKDKGDNRIENLREGASVNNHNRLMPLPSSGLIGAQWNKDKQKYRSSIRIDNKVYHLGYFNCPKEASLAYIKKKEEVLNA